MVIAAVIEAIAKNSGLLLIVLAFIVAIAKIRRNVAAGRPAEAAYTLWGEVLVYPVGIGFVYFGLLHAYAQGIAAPAIGWEPSPFEYELGWAEIPLGAVAILSLWRGFEFRLAASIVFAVFALAAAAQHVQLILCCHNYSPGNAGWILWVYDIALPIVVTICACIAAGRRPLPSE